MTTMPYQLWCQMSNIAASGEEVPKVRNSREVEEGKGK